MDNTLKGLLVTDLGSKNPRHDSVPCDRMALWGATPGADFLVAVDSERDGFDEPQVQALVGWIEAWRALEPDLHVVIAAQMERTLDHRRWRLKGLRDLLQLLGIPRENIKYAEHELAGSTVRSGSDMLLIRRLGAESVDWR